MLPFICETAPCVRVVTHMSVVTDHIPYFTMPACHLPYTDTLRKRIPVTTPRIAVRGMVMERVTVRHDLRIWARDNANLLKT